MNEASPPPSAQFDAEATPSSERPALRIWPPVVIAIAVAVAMTVPGMIAPGTLLQFFSMMLGPLVGILLMLVWWLAFSRRPTLAERGIGLLLVIVAATATAFAAHPTTRMPLIGHGSASVIAALAVWFVLASRAPWRVQRMGAAGTLVVVLGLWCLVRSEGVDGMIRPKLVSRFALSKEQQYVRALAKQTQPSEQGDATETLSASAGDWLGFRGAQRDGAVRGVQIETDWEAHPPKLLWKRPIGPAWSSFAVVGKRIYTQEQRDQEEAVVCLDADSGEQIWAHTNSTRFWESMAGAGPRATPTFHEGHILALGANGDLNCLDAASGKPIWSAQIAEDADAKVPEWGFASSPLVTGEVVLVYAGGGEGQGVLAYDRQTGDLRWKAGNGTHSYSSPQPVELFGVAQVLMLTERGVFSLAPDSGDELWNHEWLLEGMSRSVQPNVLGNRVYLGTGFGKGTRSVLVQHSEDGFQAEKEWTSRALKPYYNDFVAHDGFLYGFDGNIFACADATTGERQWKRGRYGNGQVLLLADQGLLLVLSEKGELVLLPASSKTPQELARFKAIEGKTWNHPVLAHGRLFVRNAEEAACLEVAVR